MFYTLIFSPPNPPPFNSSHPETIFFNQYYSYIYNNKSVICDEIPTRVVFKERWFSKIPSQILGLKSIKTMFWAILDQFQSHNFIFNSTIAYLSN